MAEFLHWLLHVLDMGVTYLDSWLVNAATDAAGRNPARATTFQALPDVIELGLLIVIGWAFRRAVRPRLAAAPPVEQPRPDQPVQTPPASASWFRSLFSIAQPAQTEQPIDNRYHCRPDGSWEYRTDKVDKEGKVVHEWATCAAPSWARQQQDPRIGPN